jgi:peptidoglycan/xylan/chitin deacetylase (PgdA/CDA1 family)
MLFTWAVRLLRCFFSREVLFFRPSSSSSSQPTKGPPTVALTFDDVPYNGTENVNAILAYLRSQGCGATLFCLGDRIERMTSSINLEGDFEVANHGYYDHSALRVGKFRISKEVMRTKLALEFKFPKEKVSPYYRPGSGLYTGSIVAAARFHGLTTVLGDVYPFDPHIPWPWWVASSVIANVGPGSIVIMHDRPWTLPALKRIVPALLAKGYRIVCVSSLMSGPVNGGQSSSSSSSSSSSQ